MGSSDWQLVVVVVMVALALQSDWLQCQAVRPLASSSVKDAQLPAAYENSAADESHDPVVRAHLIGSNSTRRALGGCGTGNPVDDCWRCDGNWEQNRQSLADCAIGFGKNAIGGRNGKIYVVTDDSDDDVVNPKVGTLRYGVIQSEPLWIIFSRNMNIKLKEELIMNSFKTIDGRGHNVHIAGGGMITVQYVNNVIIHNVHIHDNQATGPAEVRSSPSHFGMRGIADGDGINIYGSHDIWVDHCYFANCADGLIDVDQGSTDITISNSYFENHDEVMLLGGRAQDTMDTNMRATVAFNHFGANLIQRMPRCRYGKFHVVNNNYQGWGMYAIGGSENPTINSEGNRFFAPNNGFAKQVTKRIDDGSGNGNFGNWRSSGDVFLNGAFFSASGDSSGDAQFFGKATSFSARPAGMVPGMTLDAGPVNCSPGVMC